MSSTVTPTISSPGIGSGLDVNSIVSQLMTVEQQPLTQLTAQEATVQSQISAYGSLKGALSALQGTVQTLATPDAFGSMTGTLGNAAVGTVSAGAGAVAGRYNLEVSQLAQSQKLVSAGFASTSNTLGSGTLTFTFGTWSGTDFTANANAGAKTVTIAPGQSSLAGIRDAVNAANIGVTASIVNDGSATGQHLVFTSSSSGASYGMQIGVTDDDGQDTDGTGLSQLAYDPAAPVGSGQNMTQRQAAQDALLTLDGIPVSSPTNSVTGAIAGLTLNLTGTNAGSPTSIVVAQNAAPATSAVNAFVQAYNALQTTITSLTKYDATTKTASVLTGDSTVRLVQSQLRSLIGGPVAGASPGLNSLSLIGITTQGDGTLTLDSAKFSAAMASNPGAVGQLFAATGTASDSLVSFVGGGTKAVPGTYDVKVTQVATQGTLAGSAPAALTVTAGSNDGLTATIDGLAVNVTLDARTYASADDLAAEVAAKINGALAQAGNGSSVTVTNHAGTLSITSTRYGSASAVQLSGSAAQGLFGAAPLATAGLDVAGTIGGLAATGSGQTLTGATGSAIEGLRLTVIGGLAGARGSVTYSQGVGYSLNQVLTSVVGSDGALQSRTDGLQRTIADMDKRRADMQTHLDQVQAAYLKQYTALDTQLSQMQSLSTYLSQQLASLPTISNSSSK